jgi:hypothetical protein
VLVAQADLPSGLIEELDRGAAVHPVFRYERSQIVVLPEVRVEVHGEQQARLRAALESGRLAADIERDDGDRLVLRPRSGRGVDALALANSLQETVKPALAQARFVRVVPRP